MKFSYHFDLWELWLNSWIGKIDLLIKVAAQQVRVVVCSIYNSTSRWRLEIHMYIQTYFEQLSCGGGRNKKYSL